MFGIERNLVRLEGGQEQPPLRLEVFFAEVGYKIPSALIENAGISTLDDLKQLIATHYEPHYPVEIQSLLTSHGQKLNASPEWPTLAAQLADLAKCLEQPPPDASKRQKLAGSQPLMLRGKEQALQPRTARLVAALSDELQLDEELALDFVARVTERQHRRDLAGMTGRAEAFDDDIGGAARQLFYFEAACSLRALGEVVRGALDDNLPHNAQHALQQAVCSLAKQNLAGSLLSAVNASRPPPGPTPSIEQRERASSLR